MFTHKEYFKEVKNIIKKYNKAVEKQDEWKIQESRDMLSQLYLFYGESVHANLKAEADLKENKRKEAFSIARNKRREEFGKGKSQQADAQAEVDVKPYYKKELKAKRAYYASRYLLEGINQVLNSMATRLHLMNKE